MANNNSSSSGIHVKKKKLKPRLRFNFTKLSHKTFTFIFVSVFLIQPAFGLFVKVQAATTQINPIADAYVDSANPAVNYGSDGLLKVKQRGASTSRESYLRFDLTNFSTVGSATINVYGEVSTSETPPADLSVVGFTDNSWVENTVNWNNKPSVTNSPLATVSLPTTTYAWYQLDVTSFINAQLAANNKSINLALVQRMNDLGKQLQFKSRETTDGNKPYLSVTTSVNQSPTLSFTEPTGNNDNASNSFNITWNDSDPDNNANISLYYDNDNQGANGVLIAKSLKEDDNGSSGTYTWDTSNILPGNYYIYGIIDDGVNAPVVSYSSGYLAVGNNAPAGEMFGSMAGKFDINDSGSATYNLPISLSPGSGSLQPSVSVSYTNNGTDGLLGEGFSVNGLSTISRCPATIAQDGTGDGVDFDSNDKFCLDGERLIVVSGSYGVSPSQYKTEHDNFSRITFTTSPDKFVVETKAGYIMTYVGARASNSTNNLFWPLRRVEDRNGNYYNVNYNFDATPADLDNGEYYPTKINYTANNGATPPLAFYNAIEFFYQDRPDKTVSTSSGAKSSLNKRLVEIKSTSNNVRVYDYKFEYAQGGITNRSHVTKITQCGATDAVCFAPTTFTWDTANSQWGSFNTQTLHGEDFLGGGTGNWAGHSGKADNNFLGDFDGDGKIDTMTFTNTIVNGKYKWDVRLSNGTNAFNKAGSGLWDGHNGGPLPADAPLGAAATNIVIGDFDGDGKADIMKWSEDTYYNTGTGNKWKLWKSTGTNFVDSGFWSGFGPSLASGVNETNIKKNTFVGDFNGDGKADLLKYYDTQATPQTNSPGDWKVSLSTGTDFQATQTWHAHWGGNENNFLGDFNGDGKTDLAAYTGANGDWKVCYSTGTSFAPCQTWHTNITSKDGVVVGKFNNDNYSDLAQYQPDGNVNVCTSDTTAFTCKSWNSNLLNANGLLAGDFNGDHQTDLITNPQAGGLWQVAIANSYDNPVGDFSNSKYWGGNSAGIKYNVVGDFNNDGKEDLAGWTGTNNGDGTGKWHVTVSNGSAFVNSPTPSTVTYWNGPVATTDLSNIRSGDFNGDGRTDIISATPNTGNWNLALSRRDASGFDMIPIANAPVANSNFNNILTGDFNGDGRTDLIGKADTNSHWHVALSSVLDLATTSNYNFSNTGTGMWTGVNSDAANTIVADFNGDGKSDLAERDPNTAGRWHVTLSNGTDFTDNGSGNWDGGPNVLVKDVVLGDFNGDGKIDLAGYTGTAGNWYVSLSTGTGFDSSIWTGGHSGGKANNIVGDFNGDGLSDIAGYDANLKVWHVSLSTGKSFGGIGSGYWKGETGGVANTIVGDFTGDGKSDITAYADATNGWHVTAPDGMKPDLLTKITTGTNLSYEISYKPLTDTSIHIPDTDATYPRYDFVAPLYVVSQYRVNDNLGTANSIRSFDYSYKGAESNLYGRGFRGFRTITETDNQTQISTTTSYKQDHLYQGLPSKVVTKKTEGSLISIINYTPKYVYQDAANKISFAYMQYVEEQSFEVNQSCKESGNGTTLSCPPYKSKVTTSTYSNVAPSPDDQKYGNVTSINVDYKDSAGNIIASNLTANTYTNDTNANWILGRLTRSNVTDSATGQTSQTRSTAFTYFTNGQIKTEVVEPDDVNLKSTKEYAYDVYGNIIQTTITGLNIPTAITKTEFDASGRYVLKTTNALNQVETKTYDTNLGVSLTVTSINGAVSTNYYDNFGRVIKQESPDGAKTETYYLKCDQYCPAGAIYKVKTRGNNIPTTTKFYGPFDELLRTVSLNYNNGTIVTDTVFDNQLRPIKVSEPFLSGDTNILWNTTTYDSVGRATQTVFADTTSESSVYNGLVTTTTNRKGQQETKISNVKDQLVISTDANGKSINFVYDPRGNTTKITDPAGNNTLMEYNILDKKTKITDPDLGITTYEYNALGQLTKQTNPKGNSITNTYDVLGRKTKSVMSEGTTNWVYDTATNGKGNLASVTSYNSYSENYTYDTLGRLLTNTTSIDGTNYVYTSEYNAIGQNTKITYPTGFNVKQAFNQIGELAQVLDSTNKILWQGENKNVRNQLTTEIYGNGVTSNYTYDATNPYLKSISTGKTTSNNVQNLNYSYDALGNLVSRQDSKRNLTENFTYDNLNRLTQTKLNGNVTSSVTYDNLGNITNRSDVGTYNYTTRPHAVTSITGGSKNNTYNYDVNGNRTSSNTGFMYYNSFDKPYSISEGTTTSTISYGPTAIKFKQIVQKGSTTETTRYLGKGYEQKVSVNGGTTTTDTFYINAGDENFAIYTKVNGAAGAIQYLHHDQLGSVESITDANGNIVESQSYDSWGLKRDANTWQPASTISTVTSKGFTSQEQLYDVNLVNMVGRIYDPVIGKFTSADPFVQFPTFTQSLNRYSYVLNNPLSYTDPSGYGIKHWLRKHLGIFQAVIAISIAIILGPGATLMGTFINGFISGFVASFAGTLVAGGSFKDALVAGVKSGVISGAEAVAFRMVGDAEKVANKLNPAAKAEHFAEAVVAHGVVGGTFEVIQGGKFEQGFLAAAFTKGFEGDINSIESQPGQIVAGAVVGGTASVLGGGKFANGAITGAYSHLYNSQGHIIERLENVLIAGGSTLGSIIEVYGTGLLYSSVEGFNSLNSTGASLFVSISQMLSGLAIVDRMAGNLIITGSRAYYAKFIIRGGFPTLLLPTGSYLHEHLTDDFGNHMQNAFVNSVQNYHSSSESLGNAWNNLVH